LKLLSLALKHFYAKLVKEEKQGELAKTVVKIKEDEHV